MKSINRVVFLVLVASEAVKAYEKVEHIKIVPGCLDEEKFEAKRTTKALSKQLTSIAKV